MILSYVAEMREIREINLVYLVFQRRKMDPASNANELFHYPKVLRKTCHNVPDQLEQTNAKIRYFTNISVFDIQF